MNVSRLPLIDTLNAFECNNPALLKTIPLLHLWNALRCRGRLQPCETCELHLRPHNGCYLCRWSPGCHTVFGSPPCLTYIKALGFIFHHLLGMNMSHLAHDLGDMHVMSKAPVEITPIRIESLAAALQVSTHLLKPNLSGLHGSRRCTKNKTHGSALS